MPKRPIFQIGGMANGNFSTVKIAPDNTGICDLVVENIGNGRGGIAFDQSLASSLLIAIGSDRRAASDDVLPPLLTALDGTQEPLEARRGWVGDILLSGDRLGSRLWLLERTKQTEQTRANAAEYAIEAVAALEEYHQAIIQVGVRWSNERERLNVTVIAGNDSVTRQVVL